MQAENKVLLQRPDVNKGQRNGRKNPPKNKKYETTNNDCLQPRFCKGKHKPFEPSGIFLENAERLFKDRQIKVINTEEECRLVIKQLRRHAEEYNVLGFDCEWVEQYYRRPVALLQLGSHRGLCALIRLCRLKLIPELQELLEDENIIKVGVESHGDEARLIEDYGITRVANTLDLNLLAKDLGYESSGLGRLAEEHLSVQLNKNKCISASNWNAYHLKAIQIYYAANDVQVAIELFKVFAEKLMPNTSNTDPKIHLRAFIEQHCAKHLERYARVKKDPFRNQEIRIVNTIDELNNAIVEIKSHCDEYNVIGFKVDWREISQDERVYFLQLASHRGLCVIVSLDKFKIFPTELQELLSDERILKVSFDIRSTVINNCHIKNTLPLQYLVCEYERKPNPKGLKKLCREFLGVQLKKETSIKLDKMKKNLGQNHAHVAIEMFKALVERIENVENDSDGTEVNLEEFIKKYCSKYINVRFNSKFVKFETAKQVVESSEEVVKLESSEQVDTNNDANQNDNNTCILI